MFGQLKTITGPAGLVTTLAYNNGRLETITNPAGRITRLKHDLRGNLVKITDPDGSVRRFAYDKRHRMIGQVSKRGFDTTYDYGGNGRLTAIRRPDGSTAGIEYRLTDDLYLTFSVGSQEGRNSGDESFATANIKFGASARPTK